jgi:hypothetical protein
VGIRPLIPANNKHHPDHRHPPKLAHSQRQPGKQFENGVKHVTSCACFCVDKKIHIFEPEMKNQMIGYDKAGK